MASDREDQTPIPPGWLFSPSNKDPGARERANQYLAVWEENRLLREELETVKLERAKLTLEVIGLRRRVSAAKETKG